VRSAFIVGSSGVGGRNTAARGKSNVIVSMASSGTYQVEEWITIAA